MSVAPATVDPRTQAQLDARARLVLATRLWAELPLEAMERWRAYGLLPQPFPSAKGRKRSARGDLAFRGLAAKYLQVHGGNAAPTEPPGSAFLGDGIIVGLRFSIDDLGRRAPLEGGGVVFEASGPNSSGVLTELLVQRLAARHRKPHPEEYRTRRFVAFAGEPMTVPLPAGAYACAVRFIRSGTGQETPIVPLGVVEVGG